MISTERLFKLLLDNLELHWPDSVSFFPLFNMFGIFSEVAYYDYDNSGDDSGDDDDVGNKHNKHQQPQVQTERRPSPMLNIMRERRAANIFNENYVTDAQYNGKWICNLISIRWSNLHYQNKHRPFTIHTSRRHFIPNEWYSLIKKHDTEKRAKISSAFIMLFHLNIYFYKKHCQIPFFSRKTHALLLSLCLMFWENREAPEYHYSSCASPWYEPSLIIRKTMKLPHCHINFGRINDVYINKTQTSENITNF